MTRLALRLGRQLRAKGRIRAGFRDLHLHPALAPIHNHSRHPNPTPISGEQRLNFKQPQVRMAKPIRVLFAIGEMSGGGSQRQLLEILRRLDRERFQPQLYVIAQEGELLAEVPTDVPLHVFARRCTLGLLVYPGQAHRARVADLAAVLAEQQIDVFYDRTYHMTLIAAGATRRRPTPRISVVVTDPRLDFETNRERFRFAKRLLLKRAYQTADQVVAVSEGVRKAAVDYYGLTPAKTLTLHNFFDIERIDALAAQPLPATETRREGEWFEIVASGRLHPQKGFNNLLEAIAELVHRRMRKHVQLRILGTGPLESSLIDCATKLKITEHVTLAGYVANPLPYYKQADLFCLSSLYEGMPNALVEAMLCQVPVLATDCPSGPGEILAGGRYGRLVPPANSKALADAIDDAVLNPQKWQKKVQPAREHIERTFSADEGIGRLVALLERIAQPPPNPTAGSRSAPGATLED
jgi:glycosyltransferase involved in cell wall biosynthesis